MLGIGAGVDGGSSDALGAAAASSAKYKNAVYIYLCGSTLETKNAAATKCISEILAANAPADTAIVIETGGTRKWRGNDIPNDALVRYLVRDGQLVEIERAAGASMGDVETLASFLEFCQQGYSAENETLIFWNHGAGSIKGVCLDENNSFDGLTPAEIGEAFDKTDARFNAVGFDACLMANFETARIVAGHADVMIASEEVEPAAGWDYKALVESVGSDSFSSSVLSSYQQKCEGNGKRLYTLSAIDLSTFAKVESSFTAFVDNVLEKRADEDDLGVVSQAACDAMAFGGQDGKSDFVDLAQFAQLLGFDSLAREIKGCSQTVCGPDRQGASGLSVFFPVSGGASLKEYLSGETSDTYALFLGRSFGGNDLGGNEVVFTDEGSVDGTSLRFAISQASTSRVQDVVYDVYQLNSGGADNCLGFSNAVTKKDNGEYVIDFSGKWIALNGHLLSCEPVDTAGGVTVFSAAVKVNGSEGSLLFSSNARTGQYALLGFVADEGDGAQGRLEDLRRDDKVTILAEKFKDDETLDTEFCETATVTVEDGMEVSSAMLPDGVYQIYGIVIDIYGGEHLTNVFVIRLESGKVVGVSCY